MVRGKTSLVLLIGLLMVGIVSATVKIESKIPEGIAFFTNIGWGLSLLLIILAGIVYGVSQTMPPDSRGKWVNTAIGLFVGGIVIAMVLGAAGMIRSLAYESLQPADSGTSAPAPVPGGVSGGDLGSIPQEPPPAS